MAATTWVMELILLKLDGWECYRYFVRQWLVFLNWLFPEIVYSLAVFYTLRLMKNVNLLVFKFLYILASLYVLFFCRGFPLVIYLLQSWKFGLPKLILSIRQRHLSGDTSFKCKYTFWGSVSSAVRFIHGLFQFFCWWFTLLKCCSFMVYVNLLLVIHIVDVFVFLISASYVENITRIRARFSSPWKFVVAAEYLSLSMWMN